MTRNRFSSNGFELGIFSSNVQNGLAQLQTELWDASWQHNIELAQKADDAGFEFLLPVGKWRGVREYPLEPDDFGGAFETLTWAAGLLASTRRIAIFGTLHVAFVNPVFAAKQVVTAHHIGAGRFALNVVSGTLANDFAMFGQTPGDHDSQYDYTEEWVTIVKRIWSETAPFDHTGRHFTLRGVMGKPKPYLGKPPLVISAGHSTRGRGFAMRHADALFTLLTELDNAPEEIRNARRMTEYGRDVPIYGSSHLVCRASRKEAEEYYRYLVYEVGAWDGVDNMAAIRQRVATLPYASVERLKERLVSGIGTLLVCGSYDDVADTYRRLHDAGLNGLAVGLIDYVDDFAALRDEVLPRLERLGLRQPPPRAAMA